MNCTQKEVNSDYKRSEKGVLRETEHFCFLLVGKGYLLIHDELTRCLPNKFVTLLKEFENVFIEGLPPICHPFVKLNTKMICCLSLFTYS